MIRNVLQSIAGIEIFPIISLLIFVAVFTFMLVWVLRTNEAQLIDVARVPLNDGVLSEHSTTRMES